jgi:competence ComEA-like helix-hairpin-helix protein
MHTRRRQIPLISSLAALGAAACLMAVAFASARAQSLPEGRGRTEFELLCGRCHELERSTRLRLTDEQWAAVVDSMVERGMGATSDELQNVVAYLAAHFGPDSPVALSKVNVNTATAAGLVRDLGLTTPEAEAIVAHRGRVGAFRDWADLAKVPGLDLKKLEAQKDRIDYSQPTSGDERREEDGA